MHYILHVCPVTIIILITFILQVCRPARTATWLVQATAGQCPCSIQHMGRPRQDVHWPTLYIVLGSIWHWSWIVMLSSSWSMLLFTFLLGMLVTGLFWKRRHSLGETPLTPQRLPAPKINVTYSSCSASILFCLLYHFYMLDTFCTRACNNWLK